MRSPIRWFGGKGNMVKKLVPLLPAHHTYVEAFVGGASLLFAKRPSPVEVYNDIDSGLVNFFRVLRDKWKFKRFYELVRLTPYAREEWDHCRATWEDCEDDVERAYRWYVAVRQSFSGYFGESWSSVVTFSSRGMAGTCSRWLSAIEGLPQIHERLMRVQIEHADWRVVLERYDRPETLFYLDPPYMMETRSGGEYEHELSEADYRDLVERLLGIAGKAILSGYAQAVYEPLEAAGWGRKDWKTACHAAGKTRATGILGAGAALEMQSRIETVWISPNGVKQQRLW